MRYALTRPPMFVHCCHCTDCQRETGSAFVINLLVERDALSVSGAAPAETIIPSASGRGQRVLRCPDCGIALWSHYGAGAAIAFVRGGTLDGGSRAVRPDVHIFTRSRLPWVALPGGVPAFAEYYEMSALWPTESWARFKAARSASPS